MKHLELSIIKKEWIKLKLALFGISIIAIGILVYFAYDLRFVVTSVEPESMAWYRFAHLGYKPYSFFVPFFVGFGAMLALFQFLPERINKRVKIITHLPLPMQKAIFLHIGVGLLYGVLFLAIFSIITIFIIYSLYPMSIVFESAKDIFFYTLGAMITYLGVSALLLEQSRQKAVIKLFGLVVIVVLFYQKNFTLYDLSWLGIFALLLFVVLDSFYSIKQTYLKSRIFHLALGVGLVFLIFSGVQKYYENYAKGFERFYIFYSPTLKDFVYQKNLGDHNFAYGIKGKRSFSEKEYESYLPFVYWSNLNMQGKLPVVIGDESFDKDAIRGARLSLTYKPSYLKDSSLNLYPLLNRIPLEGMIRFPEEAMSFRDDKVVAYHFDKGIDTELTERLNASLKDVGVKMPIKSVWGKTTNMKPFDLGYLLKDSSDNLFNLKRVDGKIIASRVEKPEGKDIVFAKISENRQKNFAGYAISEDGDFYLLGFEDFSFIKLPLEGFDYKSMKLKLISDPLYYTIRYDNSQEYHGVVFNKNLELVDSVKIGFDQK